MKTPSEDIFKLIKSLNAQEKVYFKTKISLYENKKNYLIVFYIINKMQIYDESKLKNILYKKGIKGNFKYLKSRTFESILETICNYHSTSSFKRIIQNHIYKAEILIKKNLFTAAEKELNKAEKLAQKAKNPQFLVEISNLKIEYYRSNKLLAKLENYCVTNKFEANIKNVKAIEDTIRLNKESIKTIIVHLKGNNTQNNYKEINKITQSTFNNHPDFYKTFDALSYYYTTNFINDLTSYNFNETSYIRQKEWVQYLEKERELLEYRLPTYLAALANYMFIQSQIGKTKELINTFEKTNKFYTSIPSKQMTQTIKDLSDRIYLSHIGNLVTLKKIKKA